MGRQVVKEIDKILRQHHNYALKIRTQDALLQSVLFSILWDEATKEKQKEVIDWIKEIDIKSLKQWLKEGELSVRELRALASSNRIRNYSRMSKTQLLDILEEKGIK